MQILINSLRCYWIELLCSPREHNLGTTHFAIHRKEIIKTVEGVCMDLCCTLREKIRRFERPGRGHCKSFQLCHVLIWVSLWFFQGHLETYHLVLLGHVLAMAGYFPPVLITTIFNVSFLSRLDAQLKGSYLASDEFDCVVFGIKAGLTYDLRCRITL